MTVTSDLILSDAGDVVYVQDRPFRRDIARAEFYMETGFLVFVYDNEDSDMIACEIEDADLKKAISSAPFLYLSWVDSQKRQGELQDGFQVPLVSIGA